MWEVQLPPAPFRPQSNVQAAVLAGFGLPLNDRELDLLIAEANVASGGDKTSVSFDVFKKVLHAS